jgi:hypothetical protein
MTGKLLNRDDTLRLPDPLVTLWRDTARPLNWRPWRALSPAEQARLRYLLVLELWMCDHRPDPTFWWGHTHRQLLELKAASGKDFDTGEQSV